MEHPIGQLMQTAMASIKDMVDVNTVVGEPIAAGNGSTIIPISKVSFGFVAGGGEYDAAHQTVPESLPFAGGSGAGVSVQPVGFLVVQDGCVRMLPATCATVADRMVELIPTVMEDVKNLLGKSGTSGMM